MCNRVNTTLDFGMVLSTYESGIFDSYQFPTNREDTLDFQELLREELSKVFNVNSMPDFYDTSILLFAYQTNKDALTNIHDWNTLKDEYKEYGSEYNPDDDDETAYFCMCSHPLKRKIFYVQADNSQIILLGSHCVHKNGGALASELYKRTHYTCISCEKSVNNDNGNVLEKICENCFKHGHIMTCIHCKKTKHCNSDSLCSGCRLRFTICKNHPKITLSIKKQSKCDMCVVEKYRAENNEFRERGLMSSEDPLVLIKKEKSRILIEQIRKENSERLITKPSVIPIQTFFETKKDHQKCLDCITQIPKSTIYVRCKPCWISTQPKKEDTLCIVCNKSTKTSWKTKCGTCYAFQRLTTKV